MAALENSFLAEKNDKKASAAAQLQILASWEAVSAGRRIFFLGVVFIEFTALSHAGFAWHAGKAPSRGRQKQAKMIVHGFNRSSAVEARLLWVYCRTGKFNATSKSSLSRTASG